MFYQMRFSIDVILKSHQEVKSLLFANLFQRKNSSKGKPLLIKNIFWEWNRLIDVIRLTILSWRVFLFPYLTSLMWRIDFNSSKENIYLLIDIIIVEEPVLSNEIFYWRYPKISLESKISSICQPLSKEELFQRKTSFD